MLYICPALDYSINNINNNICKSYICDINNSSENETRRDIDMMSEFQMSFVSSSDLKTFSKLKTKGMFLANNASEFRCVVMGRLFVQEDSEFHPARPGVLARCVLPGYYLNM